MARLAENGMSGFGRRKRVDRVEAEKLIRQGLTNVEIGLRLGCAPNTLVEIKRKLGFPIQAVGGSKILASQQMKARMRAPTEGRAAFDHAIKITNAARSPEARNGIRSGQAAAERRLREPSLPFDTFRDAANTNSAPPPVSRTRLPETDNRERVPSDPSASVDSELVRQARNIPMPSLAKRGCRWPVNSAATSDGHLFCNSPAGHAVYCAAHARVSTGAGTPSERRAMQGIAAE